MSKEANLSTSERLGLTLDEVARALNCSTRHLQKLVKAGRFCPPIRLGRSVRWRPADLHAHLESLKAEGGAA